MDKELKESLELAGKLNMNFNKEQLIKITIAFLKETMTHENRLIFLDRQIRYLK